MQYKDSEKDSKNPPKTFLEAFKYALDQRSKAIEKMWAQINKKPEPYKKGKKAIAKRKTG